ncbi:MAG: pyridine nucleotide-disulfide oxidoreductase [Gammaproteobacteria bacterium RIFCSPHIGHO2_12_FULL_38_11]|nr:MAG: pyridine nucleotide-disulfide oxidoreductase [Gammaproteobacteria bacterium RIFCSPHIGHO2_12_FULL_38_11]
MTQNKFELKLKNCDFQALQTAEGLSLLDEWFIKKLSAEQHELAEQLKVYRDGKLHNPQEISELIIACAPVLENFIAELFQIESAVATLKKEICAHDPIFQFKDYYIHHAKRLAKSVSGAPFNQDIFINPFMTNAENDFELAVAKLGVHYLSDPEKYKLDIEKLIHWCALALFTDEGKKFTENWVSFHQPQKKEYENLVPMVPVKNDEFARFEGPKETQRERDGFSLTDPRMPLRDVLDEIHYCVYCHKNDGDFCSKGFPVKKNNPKMGLKLNPVGDILTGCPLEEKISEMHVVKKSGYSIAALAIITIDNPMCAVTGHRICNDCMKACIYQKQDPVNIPEIETRVLTDVLDLPWGVEIYDLLIKWNPLRQTQFIPKFYNHKKVLVMGMGPAGFTLSHHLLMEGCAVVGADGLKIEPLPKELLSNPIYDFNSLKESLDDRIMSGFGGVSEYGITVRWDKNFLKLIYISLARRSHFQLLGGVRFGGTITLENAWALGFDHVSIAVGAGLPKELLIPNSLASGMRQANDFLMALQLTGAVKKTSLANLQVRLPAVIIGGGLTGIDTATEVQAYYITQVEKTHQRYHILKNNIGENNLRLNFDAHSLGILDESLLHAEEIIAERELANSENRKPQLNKLIRKWGGVTVAYRKSIQESPAYQRNHEEVIKALEEGIYYAQGLDPVSVILDEYGDCAGITCRSRIQDEFGVWQISDEEKTLPAKSIFVATGAKPNIAYEFEHRGTFVRDKDIYKTYTEENNQLIPVEKIGHVKEPFGIFTSYAQNDHRVSFIGDTHPVFHGSVVKAIASGKLGYPKIMDALHVAVETRVASYPEFRERINNLFNAMIVSNTREKNNLIKLVIHAPIAAQQFQPGQFYRIQNFETFSTIVNGSGSAGDRVSTKLQTETIAALGIHDEKNPDQLIFYIIEAGASSKIIATLKPNEPISLMGPTGAKIHIPEKPQAILIVGGLFALFYLLSVGTALKAAGHKIYFICDAPENQRVEQAKINEIADTILFSKESHEADVSERSKCVIDAMQSIDLKTVENIYVVGSASLLKTIQDARATTLKHHLNPAVKFTASVYGAMQCMLKGVCAQCLQWQIDPVTGRRTKAVYACSWQHQPMEIIDIDNINERLGQNKMQETLTNVWLDYLLNINDTVTNFALSKLNKLPG